MPLHSIFHTDYSLLRPDLKAHIPVELTQASIQNAYAQLSAPPPGLPPRRVQPRRQASMNQRIASSSRHGPTRQISGNMGIPRQRSTNNMVIDTAMPAGTSATTQQITSEPETLSGATAARPQRSAEKEVILRATERTPIWSTHYLDPALRTFGMPHGFTNMANIALSGLSSGQKTKYDSTIGAPIDGVAKMAKDWVVPPDGRFVTEAGGIEVGLGIIDSGGEGWGKEKSRRRARIDVISRTGGIKVDVVSWAES
jgi:hypothetical protein